MLCHWFWLRNFRHFHTRSLTMVLLIDWSLLQNPLPKYMRATLHNHTIEEQHRDTSFLYHCCHEQKDQSLLLALTTIMQKRRRRRSTSTRRSTRTRRMQNKEDVGIWSQKLQCDLSSMAFLCALWKWTISLHSKWMRGVEGEKGWGNAAHEVLEPEEWSPRTAGLGLLQEQFVVVVAAAEVLVEFSWLLELACAVFVPSLRSIQTLL